MQIRRNLSILWAEFLAIYYEGDISYKYINSNDMWEFEIHDVYGSIYKTKGLRK